MDFVQKRKRASAREKEEKCKIFSPRSFYGVVPTYVIVLPVSS